MPTCPGCGDQLTVLDPPPNDATPPFMCEADVRGWWPAELTPEARAAWDPVTRTFGAEHDAIQVAIELDREEG